ncbi:hypothetical protein PT974_12470 [Cladobotryum mycophilum]|uniref:Uncharacterized protein n=1 Tax=Cladobotryum mycophilum TaxID=491253 RepID=A0ABR0S971_9HYPO
MESPKSQDMLTPNTSAASVTNSATEGTYKPNDAWDGRCISIPWPGGTYNIIERSSGRAMVINEHRYISLQDIGDDPSPRHRWMCVEELGNFGFVNIQTGFYLCRDDKFGLGCWGNGVGESEYVIPRKKPDGGYELLFHYGPHYLRRVCVDEDGVSLMLRLHGITSFEFIKVC